MTKKRNGRKKRIGTRKESEEKTKIGKRTKTEIADQVVVIGTEVVVAIAKIEIVVEAGAVTVVVLAVHVIPVGNLVVLIGTEESGRAVQKEERIVNVIAADGLLLQLKNS